MAKKQFSARIDFLVATEPYQEEIERANVDKRRLLKIVRLVEELGAALDEAGLTLYCNGSPHVVTSPKDKAVENEDVVASFTHLNCFEGGDF